LSAGGLDTVRLVWWVPAQLSAVIADAVHEGTKRTAEDGRTLRVVAPGGLLDEATGEHGAQADVMPASAWMRAPGRAGS
jgi:hypothetical protein